jgi:formate hydrogenlyase subunit 6/NADH:ubiquinone oxidoreductase subunit I
MSHVVTQKCISELYAACQAVCPANAMHVVVLPTGYPSAGQSMMAIDPSACTDCGNCKPACPIDAIVSTVDVDVAWSVINASLAPGAQNALWATPRKTTEAPRRAENRLR